MVGPFSLLYDTMVQTCRLQFLCPYLFIYSANIKICSYIYLQKGNLFIYYYEDFMNFHIFHYRIVIKFLTFMGASGSYKLMQIGY